MRVIYHIVSSIALIAMVTISTSCQDFLDRSPQGQFTEDDNPGALVDGKVYNVYFLMRNYNITAGIPAFAIHMMRSEDSEKGSDAGDGDNIASMFDNFNYVATEGTLGAYWGQNYSIIYQCNEILDDIAVGNLTDEGSNRNKGEAYFFRAFAYFNLVRAFGEVPLVTIKVTDAAQANVPKSSVDAIYQLIDADLAEAEELLPQRWDPEFLGRLTWGAARSLHARTYMTRNMWNEMREASTEVVNSGIYTLNLPYNLIFTDIGENSNGSVFELQCTATAAQRADLAIGSQFCEVQGVRGAGQWNLGWGWHMATQELVEAFEVGDPRKDATLLYFRRSENDTITPANTNTPYGESPVSTAMGAAFNKKAYTDPARRREFTNTGFWVNIRLIRYSDVVLMAAEAANELGLSAEASNYLEMIRAAARGSDTSILPPVTSLNPATLRDAIRHERRVELGLEPDRFYDLVRWGIAAQVLSAAGKVNYQDRNALLPIPQTEIDRSGGVLVQNPDY